MSILCYVSLQVLKPATRLLQQSASLARIICSEMKTHSMCHTFNDILFLVQPYTNCLPTPVITHAWISLIYYFRCRTVLYEYVDQPSSVCMCMCACVCVCVKLNDFGFQTDQIWAHHASGTRPNTNVCQPTTKL